MRVHQLALTAFGPFATRIDVDLDPLFVVGNADALGRAVTNLLDNAARHSPPGGTVTVRAREADDDRWHLEVVDEGPGVGVRRACRELHTGEQRRGGGRRRVDESVDVRRREVGAVVDARGPELDGELHAGSVVELVAVDP